MATRKKKAKSKSRKRTAPAKAKEAKPELSPELASAVVELLTEADMKKYRKKVSQFKEDFPLFFQSASGFVDSDPSLVGFRRFSERAVSTDLDDSRQDRQYQTAVLLYHKSPFARYFVDLRTAFLTDGEIQVDAAEQQVADWIQGFFDDPLTNWEEYRTLIARDQILSGEILQWPHVNRETGHVRPAYLTPWFIKGRPSPMPGFPHIADKIRLRVQALRELGERVDKNDPTASEVKEVILPRIVDGEEKLSGDVFFVAVNRILSSLRGHSPLLSSADHIDAIDEALFAMIERLYILNLFVWHLTYEGYSEEKLRAKRRELEANGHPRPGAFFLTNEKAKLNPLTASFGNQDFVAGFDKALNVSAMSFGIPQAWLGLGDLVNRASAQVSETPILKMLHQGRKSYRNFERNLLQYHVLKGVEHRSLRGVKDTSFRISYEELSKQDQTQTAGTLSTLTGAMSVAVAEGLLDSRQARRLVEFVAEQIVKLPERVDQVETPAADPSLSTDQDRDFEGEDPRSIDRAQAAADALGEDLVEELDEAKKKKRGRKKYSAAVGI